MNAKANGKSRTASTRPERNKLVQEAQAERGAQARQHQAQLAGLKTKADQMRNLAIGASAVCHSDRHHGHHPGHPDLTEQAPMPLQSLNLLPELANLLDDLRTGR